LYVEDHVKVLEGLVFSDISCQSINISGLNEISNLDLVCSIVELIQQKEISDFDYSSLIKHVEDRPGHDRRYALNNQKLLRLVGNVEFTDFKYAMNKTIDYYLKNSLTEI
jgi:dTDP-glucose 4,6-dehydratase